MILYSPGLGSDTVSLTPAMGIDKPIPCAMVRLKEYLRAKFGKGVVGAGVRSSLRGLHWLENVDNCKSRTDVIFHQCCGSTLEQSNLKTSVLLRKPSSFVVGSKTTGTATT